MAYNFDPQQLQRQVEDMQRQYRQLTQMSPQQTLPPLSAPQPIITPHQVQYVEGMTGARMYQDNLIPNSSEIIMDKDDDIFYRVSKDANGIPAKKIPMARFTIEEPQEEEDQMYLTKKDLNDFKEEIAALIAQMKPAPPSMPKITTQEKSSK